MTHQAKWPLNVPKAAFKHPLLSKVVSRLRIPVPAGVYKLKTAEGQETRLLRIRQTVTAVIKYERLELNYYRADLCRGYCERLISDAIRYGPESEDMMDMADFWLLEKQLVHKLFKVLVPRFENYTTSYTRFYRAPNWYHSDNFHPDLNKCPYDREINEPDSYQRMVSYPKAVLELKGHPFPPLKINSATNPLLLHNVLLSAAKSEYFAKQRRSDNTSAPLQSQDESSTYEESITHDEKGISMTNSPDNSSPNSSSPISSA